MSFDPNAPLPGAPDPWAASSMPELRGRPPYLMTEMIAAEPALAERIVSRVGSQESMTSLAERIRAAAESAEPIVLTGCGTSEHAAMAVAALLREALGAEEGRVTSVQAFELTRVPPSRGLVLAVSHEGGTDATNAAMAASRSAGATIALITVSDRSPGAELADLVITTEEQDQSWCHTVGYLSPVVTGVVLAARLGAEPVEGRAMRTLMTAAAAQDPDDPAGALAGCRRLLVVGSGVDRVAARELALKIEEGVRLPATAHELESVRHGHFAAHDAETGFVLILTDGEARGSDLSKRAQSVLKAVRELRMPAVAILAADRSDEMPTELTPGGRLLVALDRGLPRLPAAILGSAIPLQLLAERLARARGVNPDPIGRDDHRQAAAADA